MSEKKKNPTKKSVHIPRIERDVQCPYMRVVYSDRISCEAPEGTGATCCMLFFNNRRNLRKWLVGECFSLRENECPLRHLLNEQYGVEGY